ncbi:MAG: ROK family protein [Pseudomonadales bacterium]
MTARIGIDLGGSKISGVVLTTHGRELARLRAATPRQDYAATVSAIAALVAQLEAAAGLEPASSPVGIGTPGSWQPRLRRMKNCNSTWLNDRPLLHDLDCAMGNRVRIANDADCLALSEAADGAAAGAASVFGVILGTGVGGALVVGGRLLAGSNGLTGEWGHVPMPYLRQEPFVVPRPADQGRFQLESRLNDRPCYCGRMNCNETFLSGPGLAATVAELGTPSRSIEELARAQDPEADSMWDLYAHMLARSLAQVVNLIDPGVVVVGGGLSNVTRLYPMLEAQIPRYAFTSARGTAGSEPDDIQVSVRPARWGDDSGVRGAARLWADT